MAVSSSLALVNPKLLSWARDRAELSTDRLAKKIGTKATNIELWENGDKRPTFQQAQKLAEVTNIPFGYLYLDKPPVENVPIPDLRTIGSVDLRKLSVNLKDVLQDTVAKQEWLIDYLIATNETTPLTFIGKFKDSTGAATVAADMKKELRIPATIHSSSDDYMRALIQAAEKKRILILRSGVVGSNTHRKLDVNEFRGFSIIHKIAPVVFINSADAPAARLFTLVHELAHLWIGSGGISDVAIKSTNKTERACNAIAGEFLVPSKDLKLTWNSNNEWRSEVQRIATKFHVSRLVIARRGKDLGFISAEDYQKYYQEDFKDYKQKKEGKSGGDPYLTASARNGKLITRLVLNEALSGRMLLRDASRMLGVQPSKLSVLAKKLEL